MAESNRRGFLRRIVSLAASAGVAGLLMDRLPGKSGIQLVQAAGTMNIDTANTGTSTTSLSSPGDPALTATNTGSGAALQGTCTAGTGVLGATTSGTGVQGTASAAAGVGVSGFAGNPSAIPIVAQGSAGQTANLQEWRGSSGGPLSVVDPNGNLGVGTSAPTSPLHVLGVGNVCRIQSTTGQAHLVLDGAGPFFDLFQSGVMKYQWGMDASAGPNTFFVYDVTNAKYRMQFDQQHGNVLFPNGNVGIGVGLPAFRLDVAGQVHATGFPTSSDMRFKTDIQPIDNALNKVLRLNGVYFKWNHLHRNVLNRSNNETRQVGLIAQQVREVIPEVVSEWSDKGATDYLAVDYSRLTAIMIEAMKELKAENKAMNGEIRELKLKIQRLVAS